MQTVRRTVALKGSAIRLLNTSFAKRSSSSSAVQARAQARIQEIDSHSHSHPANSELEPTIPIPIPFTGTSTSTSVSKHLTDTFNRRHNYLRISLTERCNLRCFYCMPSEGIELSPDGKLLTNEEMLRLATLFVKSGVTKIRLTGGEPTVRKGIVDIVSSLNELRKYGLKSIGMTSNGLALHRKLPQLVENGLTHLNLSLDTLDPFKFELITRRRGHESVLKALDVALSSTSTLTTSTPTSSTSTSTPKSTSGKLTSVKLNVVVIKGLNDGEVLDFVEMTREREVSVRFIEFMPFTGNKWDQAKMVPSSTLLSRIRTAHPSVTRAPDELNDTARSWLIPGYKGTFGFISSMSDHFCASCNRLRLTADGQIKVCLFDAKEVSLRDRLRAGASDEDLLHTIGAAVSGKKEKHAGMQDIDVVTNRPMILIGDESACRAGKARTTKSKLFIPRTMRSSMQSSHASVMPFIAPSVAASHVRLYSTSPSHEAAYTTPHLTHLDAHGRASMVDVSDKHPTKRSATASGRIYIPEIAYHLVTKTYAYESRDEDNATENAQNAQQTRAIEKARRKGDALTVAHLAGIMGAKATSSLIPLCHPLSLSKIDVRLTPQSHQSPHAPKTPDASDAPDASSTMRSAPRARYSILCEATVTCEGKTGVEMEALTAVSVALLTVWDMLKAVAGREMEIGGIKVTRKSGGRSGDFVRSDDQDGL